MKFAAIDPGGSSALAVIDGLKLTTIDCKTNFLEACNIFKQFNSKDIIGIEDVHGLAYGPGVSFSLGKSVGKFEGVLEFLGLPHVKISIKDWQAATTKAPIKPSKKDLTTTELKKINADHKKALKMESFRSAQNAFPKYPLASHDVADAVNMARYLRLVYQGGNSI